jgi:hypothetical protein
LVTNSPQRDRSRPPEYAHYAPAIRPRRQIQTSSRRSRAPVRGALGDQPVLGKLTLELRTEAQSEA